MEKALMDLLPRLIPGILSPQINAVLYSVWYESNNGYNYLWPVLELMVPGFDPIIPIQIPVWADYYDIFRFAQAYLLYFQLQTKMNFHYNDRTCSGIFLRAIQHTDYADTVTTLQAQVNTYCKFDDGYLPSHLCLHGLATRIHQNAMARLRDIASPRICCFDGGSSQIQGAPTINRFDWNIRSKCWRGGSGDAGDIRWDQAYASPRGSIRFVTHRVEDPPHKPRGQGRLARPDRNRRPFLLDVQCDSCKHVGHVAKHCDMLATAICLEHYMERDLSSTVWDSIDQDWLARWKEHLGNPDKTPPPSPPGICRGA